MDLEAEAVSEEVAGAFDKHNDLLKEDPGKSNRKAYKLYLLTSYRS